MQIPKSEKKKSCPPPPKFWGRPCIFTCLLFICGCIATCCYIHVVTPLMLSHYITIIESKQTVGILKPALRKTPCKHTITTIDHIDTKQIYFISHIEF